MHILSIFKITLKVFLFIVSVGRRRKAGMKKLHGACAPERKEIRPYYCFPVLQTFTFFHDFICSLKYC